MLQSASSGLTVRHARLKAHRFCVGLLTAATVLLFAKTATAQAAFLPPWDPNWGTNFPTCAGQTRPTPLKAMLAERTERSSHLSGHGIVNCEDVGNAYAFTIDYFSFSLASESKWNSAHLEWFGCAVQRQGSDGSNDWIYDEIRPIKVVITSGAKRVSIANLSFRIPKSTLEHARGFGFYVVGGRIMWSIFLL